MCTQEQYYLPKEFSTVFIFVNGCFQWWCSKNIFRILQNASHKNIGESLIKIDKERITNSPKSWFKIAQETTKMNAFKHVHRTSPKSPTSIFYCILNKELLFSNPLM